MNAILNIREMQPADATVAAALANELGYAITAELFAERFATLSHDANAVNDCTARRLFVAEHETLGVIGWVYVYSMQPLLTDRYAEIGGLVVATRARRIGAGAALMRAAEAWASEQGYSAMRLRSGLHRPEAHLFYVKIGYEKARESTQFRKVLRAP